MDWITTYASETQLQQTVNALAQCNDRTARFGLSLTAREMVEEGVDKAMDGITPMALAVGFVAAFLTGCAACRLMINLVKKGKMLWFAVYCAVVGVIVLVSQLC